MTDEQLVFYCSPTLAGLKTGNLFLGYPVEDVRGFIEQGSDRCKCTGCWKVYGDVRSAEKLFAKYDCCTACYLRQLAAGTPLDRLAVAV